MNYLLTYEPENEHQILPKQKLINKWGKVKILFSFYSISKNLA